MRKTPLVILLAAMTVFHLFVRDSSASSGTSVGLEGKGVWSKGLDVYRAEHRVEEKAGKGWAYRKKLLLTYGASVHTKNEVSLRELRGAEDVASRAIGQGKAGLVFHLLRRLAGEEAFSRVADKLIRERASGSWDDVRVLFEKEIGQDLGWFFKQWVDRKGLPDLSIENVAVRRSGSRFEVSFDLLQKGDVYALDIPASISFLRGGHETEIVKMDTEKKHASFFVDDEPAAVVIDRDYDVPRKLTDAEKPPLLATLLLDEQPILVPPAGGAGIYAGVIDAWKQRGAEERKDPDIKVADIKASSLVVFGADNPLITRLYGRSEAGDGDLSMLAKKNPWNPDTVVVVVQARSATAASPSVRAVIESGECSSLSIDAHGQKRQKTAESERGIIMELRTVAAAIDVSALKTLTEVIEKSSAKRIVYVGEFHDRFAHHNVQLQVIKDLHRKDPKIAVGMEMFQRPFQKVLDDYINGAIDERTFLKNSEYFKRWNYDYNLYKPILDFARAEKIPVIALNLRSEITEKVSTSGMDSLTEDERRDVPAQLDFSDSDYRDRIEQVFGEHKGRGERNFDFFYQAQILWDETMAQSVDEYLQKNPDRRMVVIAGLGHLAYGAGIPKRVLRRNGLSYATVLNDADVERDIADYLVFPQSLEAMMAPKLMVALKEAAGRVSITDLPEGSVSKNAGIMAGDTLIALDGAPVRGVDDIKIELFYRKSNDTVRVKVLRKRFLLGDREMEFDVKLP